MDDYFDYNEEEVETREVVYEDADTGQSNYGASPQKRKRGKAKKRNGDDDEDDEPRERRKKQPIKVPDEKTIKEAEFVQASQQGKLDKMEELMNDSHCDIDVNAKSHGNTSLMYACFYAHTEMLEWLLQNGADPLIQNLNGVTALMWAVERNHPEVVETLLKHDNGKHTEKLINMKDKQGYTALHRTSKAGNLKLTMILMDTGKVDINAESSDDTGRVTALQEAANYGHNEVVLQLLEGANLNQRSKKGHTALMRAAMMGHAMVVSSLVELIEDKSDLDIEDAIGKTALHWAVFFNKLECVKVLVEAGADVEKTDRSRNTPEQVARNKNYESIVEYFESRKQNEENGAEVGEVEEQLFTSVE